MDVSGLKTLNAIAPFHFHLHFRSKALFFRSLYFSQLKHKFHLSISSPRFYPLCSLAERGEDSSLPLPRGVGEALTEEVSRRKLLQVVLVSPQVSLKMVRVFQKTSALVFISSIPGNTGCIARTCAASAVGLHLVGVDIPGFQVDDTKLKRAGLDYWPYVVVKVHGSWMEFREYFRQQDGEKRLLAFTKRGTAIHSLLNTSVRVPLRDFSYRRGDYLIFGSETCGLPPEVLLDCKSETFGGGTIRIPMVETYVRCLNLSVSVGIALYEASRQLNYEQLQVPSKDFGGTTEVTEQSFITEDVFA
ncbi:putative tRNA (cytidine(34)-2'-O)-methyltransferase [Morella rubra]|uniref:Putative tRNA (Cytidine(34)-2'-O)-methyltransferase n=1 Tax=Morella rubra TaxID=262757 RepID=A0A6A1WHP7_9ROSI|nr:putative tRNA (cytidine(34)-2'-O)-methyltransferase [Morella rubra]KAB1224805.1 putative tRNA (cytidine(34)-2'-O)-methyltransferase [Morella rubra]